MFLRPLSALPAHGMRLTFDSLQSWADDVTMSVQRSIDRADLPRQHTVQVTAQRPVFLRAMSDRRHGTSDDVAEPVRDQIGSVSRQGVNDVLSVLVDKDLVRRFQLAGSFARYEQGVGDNRHDLVCRFCGQTSSSTARSGRCRAFAPPTTGVTRSKRPRSSTGAAVPPAGSEPTAPEHANKFVRPRCQ